MPAYLKQAPAGVPGDVTRTDESNVEPAMLVALSSVFAQVFGQAMRYVTGGIQQWTTGLTKADFAGILIRQVPGISGSSASDASFSGTVPNTLVLNGLLVRGYASVQCTHGTPVRGAAPYVRIVSASGRPIGAFEADADGGNSVLLDVDQATWASDGLDADGNAELRVRR